LCDRHGLGRVGRSCDGTRENEHENQHLQHRPSTPGFQTWNGPDQSTISILFRIPGSLLQESYFDRQPRIGRNDQNIMNCTSKPECESDFHVVFIRIFAFEIVLKCGLSGFCEMFLFEFYSEAASML